MFTPPLEPSLGKALLVVSGFQITEQDYDNAIAALHDKFANPERVKQALVLQLANMQKPKNCVKDLEQFKLDFERIMKTLKHYVPDLQSSHWLISILLQTSYLQRQKCLFFRSFRPNIFLLINSAQVLPTTLNFLISLQIVANYPLKTNPKVQPRRNRYRQTKLKLGLIR